MVFAAACVAMLAPGAAGPGGLIFLLALAAAGLVFLYIIASGRGVSGVVGPSPEEHEAASRMSADDALAVFETLSDAVLLVDGDGSAQVGNSAYYTLAEEAGVYGDSVRPPGFDRVFGAHPAVGAAIFRLARAVRRGEALRERLPTAPFGVDQELRRFELDVTPLSGKRAIWRARSIAVGEPTTADEVSETPTDNLLDAAPVGFFCAARDGRVVYTNQTLRDWLGPGAERPDLYVGHFVGGDGLQAIAPKRTPDGLTRAEVTLKARDGIAAPALIVTSWPSDDTDGVSRSVVYAQAGGGAPMGVAQALSSPTVSKAGTSLDAMFVNAPLGVVRLEGEEVSNATITDANPAFLEMTKGAGGPGEWFAKLFAIDDDEAKRRFQEGTAGAKKPVDAVLNLPANPTAKAKAANASKQTDKRYVQVYFAPEKLGRLTAYVVDVTDRKKLESQLSHSGRMNAIGDLAGGVAHDVNNKLTAMQGGVDELKMRHPVGDPTYEIVRKLESNITGAAAMARQLLAYARRDIVRPEVIDIPAFVSSHAMWMRDVVDKSFVQLETQTNRAPAVKMGVSQLEQVLLNLVTNASFAMKEKSKSAGLNTAKGKVTMRTGLATPEERARANVPDDGRDYAVIEVADTGSGIPPEVLDQIFDPFFTTKAQGEGTGMGLSMVQGATAQAGGFVAVDSHVGKGTTFWILLPACDAAEAAAAEEARMEEARRKAKEREIAETDDLSGTERVMFVDDEPAVRQHAVRMLKKQGYDVIEACDGEEALELLEEHAGVVDLLVSDIAMPIKTGIELLRESKPHLGDAPVILMSGYTQSHYAAELEQHPEVRFLMKPYTLDQLSRAVKAALAMR